MSPTNLNDRNYRTAPLHVFWQPGLIIPKQDKISDVCKRGCERKKEGEQTVFPFTAPLISIGITSMQRPFSHAWLNPYLAAVRQKDEGWFEGGGTGLGSSINNTFLS